jgi:hypothetical protein
MPDEIKSSDTIKIFEHQITSGRVAVPQSDDDLSFEEQRTLAQDDTRKKFAVLFLRAYFIIIGICIVSVSIIYILEYIRKPETANASMVKDVMLALIASISGTLGFVIGFYFKNSGS